MAKQNWIEANADTAANFVRAWDATTKWVYDPANKAEILAITKKTMGGSDKAAEAVYNPACRWQVRVAEPAHQ